MYYIFFSMALSAVQPLIASKEEVFTFDISKSEQQEPFFDADYYAKTDDSSYDAVCDRSPVLRTPFYTRMITHLYIFLHSKSLRIKQFAAIQYHVFKYRTDLFFKTLFNRIKQLRNKIL